MSALKIQVTTAGRAALVNAQNTGTLPVTVAKIGVTDQAFAADASLTALPGQLKQLDTFSGSAVASDTIHVTIRDFSTDTYSLRGFGLFLADGTLFAVYGDDSGAVILEKSAQAAMLLATDVIFADIDAAALTFGDTNFLNPPATTETQGVVELATDAEAIAGTDATRALTPKGLMAKLVDLLGAGAPSAFVKTLLTAASAAAFRAVLAIKSAALYDTGAGNGLDADKLDGQQGSFYQAWANLTGVPGSFPPSNHNQDASTITTGVLPVARGGTGVGAHTAGSYLLGNGADPVASKTPAQVLADINAAAKVHSHAISEVNGLQLALDGKAPLVSPAFTGMPTAPTPAATDNSTRISTTAFVQQVVANLINGSPGALDTLNELAAAMGDDPNFAATVTNALAGKVAKGGDTMSGTLSFQGNGTAARRFNIFHNANASSDFGGKLQLDASNSTTPLGGMVILPYGGNGFQTRIDWYTKAADFYDSAYNLAMSLTAGGLKVAGAVTFGETLISSTSNIVVGTTGAGTIYWRPNGFGSVTGQVSLSSSGNMTVAGSITPAGGYDYGSSIKLKADHPLEPMPYGLAEIEKIETYRGRYNTDYCDDGRARLFFVIEQLGAIIPEVEKKGAIGYRGEKVSAAQFEQLWPVAVRAMQQLSEQIKALRAEVDHLKGTA